MAALPKTRHGRAVSFHVSVTQELTTLGTSEGEIAGVTHVQPAIVDSPCELEDHGFLFRVEARIVGEEAAIEAGRYCLGP